MRSTVRITTLVATLLATLVLTSPAMAKGGGGGGGGAGGGGACATIDSLNVNPTATGRSLDAVVTVKCVDEHSGAVVFDYINADAGVQFGRAVIMSNLGTRTYSIPLGASTTGTPTLVNVTVYAPNGKVQDTRSIVVA